MRRSLVAVLVGWLVLVLAGCAGDGADAGDEPGEEPSAAERDEALRTELLEMAEQDQEERTSGAMMDDQPRTDRLAEIIEEHGWPTYDLVGKDGEDAAWLIAQHSDLDPEFQAEALELLRAAVEDGQASPGNLAYLEDRVRAGKGEPQLYGTQMGCSRQGKPLEPEIEDPDGLEQRREDAGLAPYADYLEEMAEACSSG